MELNTITVLCLITGAAALSFGVMYCVMWLGCVLDGREW